MPTFTWIRKYIFNEQHDFKAFTERNLPLEEANTKILLLIDGKDLKRSISNLGKDSAENSKQKALYLNTHLLAEINENSYYYRDYRDRYPHTSMHDRGIEGEKVIVKANY